MMRSNNLFYFQSTSLYLIGAHLEKKPLSPYNCFTILTLLYLFKELILLFKTDAGPYGARSKPN